MWKIAGGIVLAVVILFVGSAVITGIAESQIAAADRKKAEALTTSLNLLQKITAEMDQRKKLKQRPIEPACWYLAAAAYRLAEARDLKMSMDAATVATDVPDLMDYIRGAGFPDTHHVVRGLAADVFNGAASPDVTFGNRLALCASGAKR